MAKIAVEDSLGNVKQILQENGHEVVSLNGGNVPDCDCCVVSGQDDNVMGMEELATEVSVINAEGLTAEEVLSAVSERLNRK
ncbi:hypothetical protein J2S00_000799 [Caldalkalibacillus uzonensis]|uniref:Uncharacterized protein n=1 Tax=Caldalkalibacillus uzonensis TaxID=353224 RepID=A0ABU0CNL7_9BACI|nr:YkuS family protein [Caldalkalibacillus uzonensis]MDQ0338016.1 hypothetical protein [Caldalkalibacillus uzonensis]